MDAETKQPQATVNDVAEMKPGLVSEILETTRERQALGLADWSDAIERAEGRAKAIAGLAAAAIFETEPHQWTRFQAKDGADRLRPKVGAAMTICTYFGITATPAEPMILEDNGDRFVLVTGVARCNLTGVEIPVRAKRFEKEHFVGRKDIGIQDVIDATLSLFVTKSAILLSGIHSVSPAKVAKIWGVPVSEVLANCDSGHGARPPKGVNGKAKGSGGRTMTEPQGKLLFAKASAKIKELGADMEAGALVDEAIIQICGAGVTKETAPIAKVTPMVDYINAWGGRQAKPKTSGARERHPDDEVF